MKKIIPVALVLALALALMIVPAFADTVYSSTYDDEAGWFVISAMPSPGSYRLQFDALGPYPAFDRTIDLVSVNGRLEADLMPYTDFSSFKLFIYSDLTVSLSGADSGGDVSVDVPITLTSVSPAPDQSAALDDFLDVISGVGTWLITALTSVTALFYTAESGLTLLGVLCVVPLGLGLIFLLVFTIVNWLRFRS